MVNNGGTRKFSLPGLGRRAVVLALVLLSGGSAAAENAPKRLAPMPLSLVTHLCTHVDRSPINFSADGAWVAHTVALPETVPGSEIAGFSPTGLPSAEGRQ